jgi:hypothetical protein
MSDAIIGTGILLKRGDGASPEVFVTLAENVTLKPPQLSRNEIDVSTHNAGTEAKILGMLRKGQVTGTCNWLPTDASHGTASGGMLADVLANVKANWRIDYPDALTSWTFPGRVQLFDVAEVGVDSPLQVAFALTIDGAITMEST